MAFRLEQTKKNTISEGDGEEKILRFMVGRFFAPF